MPRPITEKEIDAYARATRVRLTRPGVVAVQQLRRDRSAARMHRRANAAAVAVAVVLFVAYIAAIRIAG